MALFTPMKVSEALAEEAAKAGGPRGPLVDEGKVTAEARARAAVEVTVVLGESGEDSKFWNPEEGQPHIEAQRVRYTRHATGGVSAEILG